MWINFQFCTVNFKLVHLAVLFCIDLINGHFINLCCRPEMVVGWYHSHPGFGCWLSGVDINTQQVGVQIYNVFRYLSFNISDYALKVVFIDVHVCYFASCFFTSQNKLSLWKIQVSVNYNHFDDLTMPWIENNLQFFVAYHKIKNCVCYWLGYDTRGRCCTHTHSLSLSLYIYIYMYWREGGRMG